MSDDYQQLVNQNALALQSRLVSDIVAEQQAKAQTEQDSTSQSKPVISEVVTVSTPTTVSKPTDEYQALQKEINKLEKAVRTASTPRTQEIIQNRLDQLYEAQRNLEKMGVAYITVTIPATTTTTQTTTTPSKDILADYSTSAISQKLGLNNTTQSTPINFNPQTQTVARVISPQETMNINQPINYFPNQTIPQGTVQPTSEVFQGVKVEDTLSRVSEATGGNPVLLVPIGYGVGLAKVGYSLTAGLPQTVKNVFEDITNPSQILEKTSVIGQRLQQEPALTTGDIAGQLSFGKVVSYGVESGVIPKPVVSETIIPSASGDVSIKSVALEYGQGKSFIVGSTKPSDSFSLSVFTRAPDVSSLLKTMPEGKEIRISTPTETAILQKSLESASESGSVVDMNRAVNFIPATQSIIAKTKNVQSAFIEGFPKTTERLNEQGVNIVLDVARTNEGYISGSFSRGAQLSKNYNIGGEEFVLNKVPRDVDIHLVGKTPEQIQLVAENTLKKFKEVGIDAQLKGEGGVVQNAILVKQKGGGYEKAVEFLGEGTIPTSEVPPDYVVGFKKSGEPITIEGTKATSLNEELRGVIQGTARLRTVDGKLDIFPPEKRLKDVGSVVVSARTLQQSKLFNNGLSQDIARFESLFDKALVRDQVKLATESPSTDVLLADFRRSSITRESSPTKSFVPPISEGSSIITSDARTFDMSKITNSSSSNKKNDTSTSNIPTKSDNSPSSSNSSKSIFSDISPSISNQPSPSSTTSPSNIPSNPNPSISGSPSESSSSTSPPSPSIFTPSPSPRIIEGSSYSPPPQTPSIMSPFSVTSNSISRKKKFLAQVKQKGKFINLGETESLSDAFNLGRKKVEQTLRASFRILDEDTNSPIRDVGILPSNLRRSKRSDNIFVQIEGNRLASQGERSEIQFAKKSKGRGIFK